MTFQQVLNEKIKPGYERLASAAGGKATGEKVKTYLQKLDKEGVSDDLEKQAKKKGLKGKRAEAYKWSVLHKRIGGHFN